MVKYFLVRLNIFANIQVNFRVMGKEGETLSRMYDDQRECLISALPTRCYKVRNMGHPYTLARICCNSKAECKYYTLGPN